MKLGKLTALLVLSTSAALIASACGDDGGSVTGSGGGGPGTGSSSTGEVEDPCAVVPMGCFDPGLCFASAPIGVSLRNDLVPLMQRSCTLSTPTEFRR